MLHRKKNVARKSNGHEREAEEEERQGVWKAEHRDAAGKQLLVFQPTGRK